MKKSKTIVAFTVVLLIVVCIVLCVLISRTSAIESNDNQNNKNQKCISCEDTSKRNQFEKHFLLSDGSFMAVSYAEAVHFLDSNGFWSEVDNTLKSVPDSSRISNSYDAFKVSFATTSDEDLVSLETKGKQLSWSLFIKTNGSGEQSTFYSNPSNIRIENNEEAIIGSEISDSTFNATKSVSRMQYSNLFESATEISVTYSVFHNKIEEDYLIYDGSSLNSISMVVHAGLLIPRLNSNKSVEFVDENNDMIYRIGIPYIEDSANEILNDIDVTVEKQEDTVVITYTPNEKWLKSEARVYPLLFDPSITTCEYSSNITDTYVYEDNTDNHSEEQKLYFGVKNGKIHRSFIKINNLPAISVNSPIISANLQLTITSGTTTGKTAELYKVTSSWNVNTITYSNQPSASSITMCPFDSGIGYYSFIVSDVIADLYKDFNAGTYNGFAIRQLGESKTNPDYNAVYSANYATSSCRPVLTIIYGYALPDSLSSGEIYALKNVGSGSFMTVHGGVDENRTNVNQLASSFTNLGAKSKFKLEYVPSTGGYYFRAMCSSGGNGRVLDIAKSNGFVADGCNVQIFNPTDSLAQHWFIIGVGTEQFVIVPRTNMSLALTVYPSSGNGTSTGTSSNSVGNIFVSSYSESNQYQKWNIVDENGINKSTISQLLESGIYYINNLSFGKYLHKNTSTSVNAAAGLISSLTNTIRWKITHISDNKYTIQSYDNPLLFLRTTGTAVSLNSPPSSGIFSDDYLWIITEGFGGCVNIKNASSSKYLYLSSETVVSTISGLGNPSNPNYFSEHWRIVLTTDYGNHSHLIYRELSSFQIEDAAVCIGSSISSVAVPTPDNAIWADTSDFVFEIVTIEGYTGSAQINNSSIIGESIGKTRVRATHKVTNLTVLFDVDVCKKAIIVLPGIMGSTLYTNELLNVINTLIPPNTRVWDPSNIIFTQPYILSLACDSSGNPVYNTGVRAPIVNNQKDSNRLYGAQNTYENLYLSLYNNFNSSHDVILFEYDWRKDPYDTAVLLDNYIRANFYSEIVFVSHSMGGNVSSYYLTLGEAQRNRVDKHISIGTPYLGAEKLIYVFDTGDALGFTSFIEELMFNNNVKIVLPNMPAIYSLLPMQTSFDPYLKKINSYQNYIVQTHSATIYNLATYLDNWNSGLYNSVVSHQSALFDNGQHITSKVDSYYVIGNDLQTVNRVAITIDANNEKSGPVLIDYQDYDGDGTVRIHSALAGGSVSGHFLYKYPGDYASAEHTGMMNDGNGENNEDATGTVAYICDVIENNYQNIDETTCDEFFNHYLGYRNIQ